MEVRCCCDAGKLLGYLPDPIRGARKMSWFSEGKKIEFEVDWITLMERPMSPYLAYKSKDYPLELLRKIPEFREAV